MKKILLACSILSLSACQTLSGQPTTTEIMNKTVVDEKAWYAAEALYNVPAQAYKELNEAGKLTPTNKAKAKAILIKMYGYLEIAYNSRHSVADFNAAVSNIKEGNTEVMALLHGGHSE